MTTAGAAVGTMTAAGTTAAGMTAAGTGMVADAASDAARQERFGSFIVGLPPLRKRLPVRVLPRFLCHEKREIETGKAPPVEPAPLRMVKLGLPQRLPSGYLIFRIASRRLFLTSPQTRSVPCFNSSHSSSPAAEIP